MPGEANYWSNPRPEKLRAAMTALATFHRLAQTYPVPLSADSESSISQRTSSPGIVERLAMARRLLDGGMAELRKCVATNRMTFPALGNQADKLLAIVSPHLASLEFELQRASQVEVAIQPCLRDIWHDHVLFCEDQVSGIVDPGSMRVESVAADISRLLGSLCENDEAGWKIGFEAYSALRPLTQAESTLLKVFDLSQMLLSGINWVEWVFVQKRAFSDPAAVLTRMEHILNRLSRQSIEIAGKKQFLTGL
jgi:Ser/Thr protein kinase RdoA (MazF antagonist)